MKLFGEFLVDQGLVSEEDVVGALMEQISSVPCIAELTFSLKLIAPKDIFKILKYQVEHQAEFRQACIEMKLWNDNIQSQIDEKLKQVRMPIGQVLLKQGKVDISALTKALDSYIMEVGNDVEADKQSKEPVKVVAPAVEQAPQSAAADDTSQEAPKSEGGGNLDLVGELFNHGKIDILNGLLNVLPEAQQQDPSGAKAREIFRKTAEGVHELVGSARYVGSKTLENLSVSLEKLLDTTARVTTPLDSAEMDFVSSSSVDSLKLVEDCRDKLAELGSEEKLDSDLTKAIESQIESLHGLKELMDSKLSPGEPVKEAA